MAHNCWIASMLLAATVAAAGRAPAATAGAPARDIRTTDPSIAMGNLEAQLRQMQRTPWSRRTDGQRTAYLELLGAHARYTGRIAELTQALALAESWAAEAPAAAALLARARLRAGVHRFAAALSDLDRAAALGASAGAVDQARAGIYQAVGRYDDALVLRRAAAARHPDSETLGALASLLGERGDVARAAPLFAAARRQYRDVSPFPYAALWFDEGAMWMRHGELARARDCFAAALRHLPSYAAAQCHLAEVEAALGETDRAIARLAPLARASDDPDAAGQLARLLRTAGETAAAARWRHTAAARYAELLDRHPEAFADHAAEFWLAAGEDPARAYAWARRNLALRQTPRAYELLITAALDNGRPRAACDAAAPARRISDGSPGLTAALRRAAAACNQVRRSPPAARRPPAGGSG
jgi:tetratricopeptide (TPR) repeat protein